MGEVEAFSIESLSTNLRFSNKENSMQDIVYYLNTEDVQMVAVENIGRELTAGEIERLKEPIAEKINWYDAILFAL